MGIDVGFELCSLELLFHIALTDVLTLAGQLVIKGETAFRRSVGLHLNILDSQLFAVGIDALEHADELLHTVVFEFAAAQIGLVDEELHVGLLLLIDHSLERIEGQTSSFMPDSLAIKLGSGNHSRSHFDRGHLDFRLTEIGVEGQIHVALLHCGHVIERGLHRITATETIGNGLVVAHNLFTLEGHGLPLGHLSARIVEFGHHGNRGFLVHVFLGELTFDGSRDLSAGHLKRIGRNGKVIGRQFA